MPSPEEGNIRRKLGRSNNANVDRAAFDIPRQAEEVRRGEVDMARAEY